MACVMLRSAIGPSSSASITFIIGYNSNNAFLCCRFRAKSKYLPKSFFPSSLMPVMDQDRNRCRRERKYFYYLF